jgi:protein TonB
MQRFDISDQIDEEVFDGRERIEDTDREEVMHFAEDLDTRRRDTYLTYGILASVVLHVALLAAIPRLGELAPAKAFLKPGEEVTPIRLVEFPTPPEKTEPPPDKASGISDRNHTAKRERIPKALPRPKAAPGKMTPSPPQIAALSPPPAPEDLVKGREKKPPEQSRVETRPAKQPAKKRRSSGEKTRESVSKRENLKKPGVDLRPTAQEIARALSGRAGPTDFYPEGDPDEAVVDINTREDRFFSYLLHLKRKIEGVWIYPSSAAKSGLGGELTLEFLVSKKGKLLGVSLLDSSGYSILDQSAIRAIRTAAPYHPFPPRLKAKRLRVRARFIYVTNRYFRRIM